MKESLPLFGDGHQPAEPAAAQTQRQPAEGLHMQAARRLARQFKRSKVQPRDRVRTGRLICRHLVAMLHDLEDQKTGAKPPH